MLVLTVFMLGVAVSSWWLHYNVRIGGTRATAMIWAGALDVTWYHERGPFNQSSYLIEARDASVGSMRWAPSLKANRQNAWGTVTTLTIPLWIPFVLLAFPAGWLFWSERRRRARFGPGRCSVCGYDISGLHSDAPCPECGGESTFSTSAT